MNSEIFKWDSYSDQPHQIKNPQYKKEMRRKNWSDILGFILPNLFIYPLALFISFMKKSKPKITQEFFGMGVNLDKGESQLALIEELGVTKVLIRVFLSDMANLQSYYSFAKSFHEKNIDILINIIQDREHIENLNTTSQDLETIFTRFSFVSEYQIGSTINRSKWGFFGVNEYLRFYKTAQTLRNQKFQNITLIGPSVIDFEFHYTLRALFNLSGVKYDKISSLLYVDRRGAPENMQSGFNLVDKIKLLSSIATLSYMSKNTLVITETNWPLTGTAPYAPTSEKECVTEHDYTSYMLRYYLLTLSTGMVESLYWHQLIAHGYGLVDNLDDQLRKREAFEAFKFMLSTLNGGEFITLKNIDKYYEIRIKKGTNLIKIVWLNGDIEHIDNIFDEAYRATGEPITDETLHISDSPIYLIKALHED